MWTNLVKKFENSYDSGVGSTGELNIIRQIRMIPVQAPLITGFFPVRLFLVTALLKCVAEHLDAKSLSLRLDRGLAFGIGLKPVNNLVMAHLV